MLTRDGRHRPLLWEPTTGRRCALFIFIFSGFLCVLFLASCFLLWEPTTGRRCAHRLLLCPFLVLFRSFSCLLLLGCFESESHLAFSRYFQVFLLPASSWLLRSRIAPSPPPSNSPGQQPAVSAFFSCLLLGFFGPEILPHPRTNRKNNEPIFVVFRRFGNFRNFVASCFLLTGKTNGKTTYRKSNDFRKKRTGKQKKGTAGANDEPETSRKSK